MRIDQKDNVAVDLETGHKYALKDIDSGEHIIKYGEVMGEATCPIREGEHVHTHNVKTTLNTDPVYKYTPTERVEIGSSERTLRAYKRRDGQIGIRNDVWIIVSVGCVNKTAEIIAKKTGAIALTHPYGCSQLGDDAQNTEKLIAALATHPNAGGVLILSLGCENSGVDRIKAHLGEYDEERIRFLVCQEAEDEIAEGVAIVKELKALAKRDKRVPVSISELKIGLKCGGSDGYSGISANPLLGKLTDRLTEYGCSSVLTEVPEMFGAEHLLMNRCENEHVFEKTVQMIEDFKEYYRSHGQVVYENPSPGNKAGGITTLEEKSLGCIKKGGKSVVTDVLKYGEKVTRPGVSLLTCPGNDIVSITAPAASGVHLILFTTGRGTPLGTVVPTAKLSSNPRLYKEKSAWIDFDSSPVLEGKELTEELLEYVIKVCEGKRTKNEINGYTQIAIFKDGVTL